MGYGMGVNKYYLILTIVGITILVVGLLGIGYYIFLKIKRLHKKNNELSIINELAVTISSKLELNDTLKNITKALEQVIDCDFCAVFEYHRETNTYVLIKHKISHVYVLNKVAREVQNMLNDNISRILEQKESTVIKEVNESQFLMDKEVATYFNSAIYEPLFIEDRYVGCVIIASKINNCYGKDELHTADLITKHVAVALKNAQMFNKVKNEAITDELTGLYNQRQFFTKLQVIDTFCKEEKTSLIIFDIDKFKKINDTYGHQTGDKIIKDVSDVIRTSIRRCDTVYRYGGEEFTVILPNTNQDDAYRIAERVRTVINNKTFFTRDGRELDITISGGISEYPQVADSSTKLLSFADRALYVGAKQKGRNKVAMY